MSKNDYKMTKNDYKMTNDTDKMPLPATKCQTRRDSHFQLDEASWGVPNATIEAQLGIARSLYPHHAVTRTAFPTWSRRMRITMMLDRNEALAISVNATSPHIAWVCPKRRHRGIGHIEYHTRRVTIYELRTITTTLDANINETLTVHNAGHY